MDYNKLKEMIISSYGQIQIFFEKEGESIDFSEGGFYQAIRNDSMKVVTLENISKKIGVPMAYWWKQSQESIVDDFMETYGDHPEVVIKQFQSRESVHLKMISKLMEENEDLKDKLGIRKVAT
jgi:hypothetical protein